MSVVIYIFEIPIVAIVMLLILISGIEPGLICEYAGSMCAVLGGGMTLFFLIGREPGSSERMSLGIRIFMMALMIVMFVIPGIEIYKVGVGMGDTKLIELILGR